MPKLTTIEGTNSRNPRDVLTPKDILLVLLAGALFTAFALQWSFSNGRLTRDPGFDDVVYFVDGLKRSQIFYSDGFQGLARDLATNPPHSPWSTGLAFFSFLILGVHDWAPYLANGILVVLFLGLSLVLARPRSMLHKILIIAFVCSFPWAIRAVQDFRPDFAVALFTAAGVLLAIPSQRSAVPGVEWKGWLLLAGFCFAMAFITKPSFVLHTTLLFGYVGAVVSARHFPWGDRRPLFQRLTYTLQPLVLLILPVICLAVPYYVLDWQHVVNYVWSNTRGDNAKFWRLPTGYLGSIWFYMVGLPAQEMMNSHLIIAPFLVTLGFIVDLARKEIHRCLYGSLVLGAAALSLLTFGVARMGNPFFGLTSQLLVSFLAIYFTGSAWDVPRRRLRGLLRVITILAMLAGIAAMLPNPASDRLPDPPVNAAKASLNQEIVRTVHGYVRENNLRGTEGLEVLVTFAGDVNDAAMTWVALKEGLPYQFSSLSYSDSVASYVEAAKTAAFLVAADQDVAGVAQWLPSNKIADKILSWLQTHSNWSLLRAIEANDELKYYIFVNFENTRRFQNLVRLGASTKGFLTPEGPYPEGLGVVRWGTAPESTTVYLLKDEGKRILELSARSIPGQTMRVMLNGKEQLQYVFETDGFEEIAIPIWMAEGENQLTLQYSAHSPVSEDNSKRAVLFRKIALLPPEQDGSNPQVGYAKPQHDSGSFVPPVRESSPAGAAVKERQTSSPPVAVPSL